jgi:hypothetical protein
LSKPTAVLISALLGTAIGLASHYAATADVNASPIVQRIETPYWSITLQSDVLGLFPSFDQPMAYSPSPTH